MVISDDAAELSPALSTRTVYAVDFSRWKRRAVRTVFGGAKVVFVEDASRIGPHAICAAWGKREIPGHLPASVPVVRLEDGFLRSVGLGADLVPPLSLVVDRRGMYYDATTPSDLEVLLGTVDFPTALTRRAADLRGRLIEAGITKYNVAGSRWVRPAGARRVILVPGQVESDAALKYGAPGIRTNRELVRAVRAANRDAYVVYKPHPDVVAGLRRRGPMDGEDWAGEADAQIPNADLAQLLEQVDEVHVMTSLAGFEALLREKPVTCYGQPFYAGWGLTTDVCPMARRTRPLLLDHLVAGALILYPTYISRRSGAITAVENAVDELLDWRSGARPGALWWRRIKRAAVRCVVGVR